MARDNYANGELIKKKENNKEQDFKFYYTPTTHDQSCHVSFAMPDTCSFINYISLNSGSCSREYPSSWLSFVSSIFLLKTQFPADAKDAALNTRRIETAGNPHKWQMATPTSTQAAQDEGRIKIKTQKRVAACPKCTKNTKTHLSVNVIKCTYYKLTLADNITIFQAFG